MASTELLLLAAFQVFAGKASSFREIQRILVPHNPQQPGERCDPSPPISACSCKAVYFGNFKMGERDSLNPKGSSRLFIGKMIARKSSYIWRTH